MNKISTVLLVGDIGTGPDAPYHVGDEAALHEVARRIRYERSDIRVVVSHQQVPPCATADRWIHDIMGGNTIPDSIAAEIGNADVVWFVGSGNLNSHFRDYLLHRTALMLASKRMGKCVIVTSQTLGPYEPEDRRCIQRGLANIQYLSVRDNLDSVAELRMMGLEGNVVGDDAALLPFTKQRRTPSNAWHVGLSLRDWDTQSSIGCVERILGLLKGSFTLHLIPHYIDREDQLDIDLMRRNFAGIAYDYKYFCSSEQRFDQEVKSLTSSMDLLICTRYHAAVFAASEGVPCIGVYESEYYRRKFEGLVSLGVNSLLATPATAELSIGAIEEVRRRPSLTNPLTPTPIDEALELCAPPVSS